MTALFTRIVNKEVRIVAKIDGFPLTKHVWDLKYEWDLLALEEGCRPEAIDVRLFDTLMTEDFLSLRGGAA